ncbi:MAG: iron-sulfur cluster assembly accessory protein [Rhodothermales bacterium]|nr:iron-sulfur cluster assembly accessory protein [Rhodothermales bacterium]
MDIQITPSAVERLRQIALKEGVDPDSTFLRIAVVPGGCSGLTYDLGWDTTRQETDRLVDVDSLQVVLDHRSWRYVEGTELDFSDGLEGKGFFFNNPQAARTCACGESFGL